MHSVLLLGAGKIGSAIAKLLADCGDYDVLVADASGEALSRLSGWPLKTMRLDASDALALRKAIDGRQIVISATSFSSNVAIAEAAAACGASYFDLTEDVKTARATRQLAEKAKDGQIFMPQCGLAPGFVSIAAHALAQRFEKLDEVLLRVGALPIFPTNEIRYNLTWSTDGLINEYGNPCDAIHEGVLRQVLPLEGLEVFSLDGVDYEAFNTSGGVGTLCETFEGQVRTLNYKTIRYRGHRALVAFLMNELRLNERRDMLKDILENAIPVTPQDVVLIFVTVTGWMGGRLTQITDARKIYHATWRGERWSAIQRTTASALCAVVDLHAAGALPRRGFVKQEQVPLEAFLANRFGRVYAEAEAAPRRSGPQQRREDGESEVMRHGAILPQG
jgi:saccharopine dehydrogenase-like NADP-dependent oxidoreductase